MSGWTISLRQLSEEGGALRTAKQCSILPVTQPLLKGFNKK